jgi:hypothetical protein
MSPVVKDEVKVCTYTELDGTRKEVDASILEQRAFDECTCRNAPLAVQTSQHTVSKFGTGIRHTERRAPRAIFSLDHFVSTELNPLHELFPSLSLDGPSVAALREQRNDRRSAVSADDGDGGIRGRGGRDACEETRCAYDVERGDAEDALRIVYAGFFKGRGNDGNGRVDWVGDYAKNGCRSDARY